MLASPRSGSTGATSLRRAIVFDGQSARLDQSRPDPKPLEGEVVIRLRKAAVSEIDLEVLRGRRGFTGVLGQQFVGVVESVNGDRAAAERHAGKRVVGSVATACGRCDRCVAGLSAHCRERTILGLDGRDGCFADRFALPVSCLTHVPAGVDDDHAVFAADLAAGLQAARQLTIVGKPYITVLGDGALALLTAQVMAKLNASVRVIGWHVARLAVCEKWGLKHRLASDVGRRADQDVVVDCTGNAEGLALAMQLVRPRGKIVLKGTPCASQTGEWGPALAPTAEVERRTLDLTPLVLHEIEVIGSFAGPMGEAVSMLERGEVDVVSLISRRFNLSEGLAALRAANQSDAVKVLIEA